MMDEIVERVGNTIRKRSLIEKGDKVLAAFSGGTDSVAMLHILQQLRDILNFSLSAVYINHKIRPRAVKREIKFCEAFCRKYSIPFITEEIDIPNLKRENKTGIEETARIYRYRTLERLADNRDFDKIAVGHHCDDRAETIIFNLLRGSGRMGLAGIPPGRGKIIRPLYDLTRLEIADYLEENSLRFMIDISNRSRKFTRNRIRRRIIPVMKKEITEAAVDNIVRYSEIMADEERFLGAVSSAAYDKLASTTPGGKIRLDLSKKSQYDVWLKRRLLFRLLESAGFIDIEFAEIERLMTLVEGDAKTRISIRDGCLVEMFDDVLYLYRPGKEIGRYRVEIPGQCRMEYPEVRISFEYVDNINVKKMEAGHGRIAYIDAEELQGDIHVSGLKRGARFRPYGRPGSKKVGDFLTDQKYPRPLRDEIPVLFDGEGIVWLAGLEIDHRVRVRKSTRKIVKVEISKD